VNCIVTAGPTYEPLDQVRRLTNFSTGQLGSELANFLAAQGHHVVLLKGYYAIHQGEQRASQVLTFTTTADLRTRLQGLAASPVGAIFHAAAVSDFGFGRIFVRNAAGELKEAESGKFSTRQGPLLAELVPTPKILSELRGWFTDAWIVGWKYEVGGTRADAIAAGAEQTSRCRTNACVINGPAFGQGFGLLVGDSEYIEAPDASALFAILARHLPGSRE
jgi:phosphopantothenoylcysteine decarboxylase/phosphopantothenate--cysteine ligase